MTKEKLQEKYKEHVDSLAKYGRYRIMASTITPKSIRKLDPTTSLAQRNIFLTDKNKKGQRKELKKWLEKWHAHLSSTEDIEELRNKATESKEKTTETINKNVKSALEQTRQLEQTYRSMQHFFENSGKDKIRKLTLMNASLEQLTHPNLDGFRTAVKKRLEKHYGSPGKADNYSVLAVPGFLGSRDNLKKWAEMAHEFKVLLVTDFEDVKDIDTVIGDFESDGYGDMREMMNVIMTCNWLIARAADTSVGEEEDVAIPPSAALAGMICNSKIPIAQPRAGKKFGTLKDVKGVRFDLLLKEIGKLDDLGLVPMTFAFNQYMAYSARTMENEADDVGLRTYSVVRVFDWVGKVIADFLNQAAFQNASQRMLDTYRAQIAKFLDSLKGKQIKDFEIKEFEIDSKQPDRIRVHIVMKPLFPAKTFLLKLDGTSGEDLNNYTWE